MKNNLLMWIVLILVIANLAILTIFLTGRGKDHPRPEQPSEFIIRELGFNNDQKESYMKLIFEHRRAADSTRENIKKAKNDFFKLLQNTDVSDSTKQIALKEISHHSESLDLITFNHFRKVRDLCTPDQQKKFDMIINQVLGMMAGPHPPPGHHPEPH